MSDKEKQEQKEEEREDLVQEVVPGVSQEEVSRIRAEAIEKAKTARHHWRQKGFYIICKTCEHQHASFIGNKNMIGEKEDGTPIFSN